MIREEIASCEVKYGVLVSAETLANPYKGKIPLPRVNSFQEPYASRQVIQQKSPNTWSDRTNQYLESILETHRIHLFPPIATEYSSLINS